MPIQTHMPIILASGSAIRQQMLRAAGIEFSVEPSGFDETSLKEAMQGTTVAEQALRLAKEKALVVSQAAPHAITIGADQICAMGDSIYSKPGSFDAAEAHLRTLAGHTHTQHSGVVLLKGDQLLWEYHAQAALTMRALTDDEIRAYVAMDKPLQSCGAYKFEAAGKHLFASIEGDHHVIQGLPLVPLLAQLHAMGAIGLRSS
jgi:septum formation protein